MCAVNTIFFSVLILSLTNLLNLAVNSLTIPNAQKISISKVNPLKPRLVQILFKNSVRTAKKTRHFTVTKINRLTLFKEIIAVYSVDHMKQINKKCKSVDC
jgi:hypothetical protein